MLSPSRREFLRIAVAALASSATAFPQSVAAALRLPYLQNVRRDRATLRWISPAPGDAVVEFWDDSRQVRSIQTASRPLEQGTEYGYEALLHSLEPGASYSYRVLVNGQPISSELAHFQTPGAAAFEFLAFGDSGNGSAMQASIANRLLTHSSQFVIHTGDLVYPAGTYDRYQSLYFDYYRDLMRNAPFFPCPGNHDYYETSSIPYRALHSVPTETVPEKDQGRYYSFDWGNAHFVSLDTNQSLFDAAWSLGGPGSGEMLQWLDADLAASQKFWRIVVMHHPAYASGVHDKELEVELIRKHIAPILDKYAVPLILNGHEHSYQRSVPIRAGEPAEGGAVYITTGGGGAALSAVTPSPLTARAASEHHYLRCAIDGASFKLEALRADGSLLDAWSLSPKPTFADNPVLDSASFGTRLAAGGLATIFGHHLAPAVFVPSGLPLPTEAPQSSVTWNGQSLPLLLSSPSQINVQLPAGAVGEGTLAVHGPNGTIERKLTISPTAPAIFDGAIFGPAGPITPDSPAHPGELIWIYATGLGEMDGAQIEVEWNGVRMEPGSFALAQGLSGVNVVTFEIPGTAAGESTLRIFAAGAPSNAVRIATA